MNSVILVGRMVADPELKTTQTGLEFTSFRIAVDRPYSKDGEKKADFIDVVAWRRTAAFICQYFDKGKPIAVKGTLQTRSYETNDGSKRFVTEVLADSVEFVPGNKKDAPTGAQTYSRPSYTATTAAAPSPEGFVESNTDKPLDINLDDDLPF